MGHPGWAPTLSLATRSATLVSHHFSLNAASESAVRLGAASDSEPLQGLECQGIGLRLGKCTIMMALPRDPPCHHVALLGHTAIAQAQVLPARGVPRALQVYKPNARVRRSIMLLGFITCPSHRIPNRIQECRRSACGGHHACSGAVRQQCRVLVAEIPAWQHNDLVQN